MFALKLTLKYKKVQFFIVSVVHFGTKKCLRINKRFSLNVFAADNGDHFHFLGQIMDIRL